MDWNIGGFDPFTQINNMTNAASDLFGFNGSTPGNYGTLGNFLTPPFGSGMFPQFQGMAQIPGLTTPLIPGGLFGDSNGGPWPNNTPPNIPQNYGFMTPQQSYGPGITPPLQSNINSPGTYNMDPSFLDKFAGPGTSQANGSGPLAFLHPGSHYVSGPTFNGFNTSSVDALARGPAQAGNWGRVADAFQNAQNNFSAWQTQYPNEGLNWDQQYGIAPGSQNSQNGFTQVPNPTQTPWILNSNQVGQDLTGAYQQAYRNYEQLGTFGVPNTVQFNQPSGGR